MANVCFFENNPKLDEIRIGFTSNLISRIEFWKEDSLLKFQELGFMKKMNWNNKLDFSVSIQQKVDPIKKSAPYIQMRLNESNGFFGDIGSIKINLERLGSSK